MRITILMAVCAAVISFSACKKAPKNAIARVNGIYITEQDLEQKTTEISPQYQNYLNTPNGKKQFLEILIREKIILAAAKDSKVPKTDEYRNSIKQAKEDMERRYEDYREYLLTKLWLANLKDTGVTAVSEEEIAEYFKKYPYEMQLSHILLSNAQEAEAVLMDIRSGRGGGFASIAKAKSLDAETADNGGKIPPFIIGQFLPELESAAVRMKTGEVQGVFKSKFGYHILRRNGEEPLTLGKAKDRIAKILEKRKLDNYLQSLENKYKTEVLDEHYAYK